MRLLYYNPSPPGGLADYAREQAAALAAQGAEVTMLALADAPAPEGARYEFRPVLLPPLSRDCGWVPTLRKSEQARRIVANALALAREARQGRFEVVLIGAFFEYLAPLWAGQLCGLRRRGVRIGAVVHDPVRDTVMGPQAWHRLSIARAYACLTHAFVHQGCTLDTVPLQPGLRTVVIPHGPYRFPPPRRTRGEVRRGWGFPEGATVLLSFGHIRDGKNLELVLRALVDLPDHCLVVSGREQSSTDRPAGWYAELADTLGVVDRVRIFPGHVAPEAVGDLFEGADIVLATYSRDFRSASGVLNVAVNFRKPVLASSGEGNLKDAMQTYDLGQWVKPDSVPAIAEGLRALATNPRTPDWDRYSRENSWEENARRVLEALQ